MEICRYQVPRGGTSISGGGGPRSRTFTFPDGETATVSGGGGSVAGGVVTGDFLLRLPLDAYWPNIHLAPYFFAGFGAIIIGSPGNGGNHEFVERTVFVSRTQGAPANQAVTSQQVGSAVGYRTTFLVAAKCSGMSAADSNTALLPILGFSANLVMTSQIWLTTTLSRPISASDTPSEVNKEARSDGRSSTVLRPWLHRKCRGEYRRSY